MNFVQPTEIYYLAAHHGSSESMTGTPYDVSVSWRTHVTGFVTLLNAVEDYGASPRVTLAASCLVYGPSEQLIDESAHLRPDSIYGTTKAAAMQIARERRSSGLPIFTAVLFPHESGLRPETFVASRVVRAAIRISAGSQERVAIARPDAVVDWSLAQDVVTTMVALSQTATPDEYIFASGRSTTVRELIEETSRQLNINLSDRIDYQPHTLVRPYGRRVGNPQRLMKAVAWRSATGIETLVERLIDSHRSVR
jgi:GDPmannose 4,6-dehydratase